MTLAAIDRLCEAVSRMTRAQVTSSTIFCLLSIVVVFSGSRLARAEGAAAIVDADDPSKASATPPVLRPAESARLGDEARAASMEVEPVARTSRLQVSAGVRVSEYNYLASDVYGLGGFLDFAHASDGLWAPSIRLSFARTLQKNMDRYLSDNNGGMMKVATADFSWTLGQLDVCPLAIPLFTSFSLVPCGAVAGGVVQVKARAPEGPTTKRTRPWGTASLLTRLQWRILPAWFVEAEVGVALSIIRDDFSFHSPETQGAGSAAGTSAQALPTFYQADVWLPFASISTGVSF
ncbi:MAG: hypothetical protein NVSMB1_19150 [Polyangiales bacterium]